MIDDKDLSRHVIEAATTERRGVYFIGPHAQRVSFSSQQNRALNLIWSLREHDLISKGDRVAVLGAGVSGITVAAALHRLGCEVTVFEAGSTMMSQERTSERFVHPTINFWPEQPLSPTTDLPFLEWSSDRCSHVCSALQTEWDKISDIKLLLRRKIASVESHGNGIVRVRAESGDEDFGKFRAVVVTGGFGTYDDRGFGGTSYWEPDDLEAQIRRDELAFIIISGCGDGGLVDALRAAHADFGGGQLPVDVASELQETALANVIRDAEAVSQQEKHRVSTRSKFLYLAAASRLADEEIYRSIFERLNASLTMRTKKVLLMDAHADHPFAGPAAPIHKLLVAHAMMRGAIEFRCGAPEVEGDQIVVGGQRIPRSSARVLERQFLASDFSALFKEFELEQHRTRCEALEPLISKPIWRGSFAGERAFATRDPADPEMINSKLASARRAAKNAFDGDISAGKGHFKIERAGRALARIPSELFGIPLELGDPPSARSLAPAPRRSRVILSYAGPDKAVALQIVDALRKADIETLLDEFDLGSGNLLTDRADIGLAANDVVLLLISAEALLSDWVQMGLGSLLSSSEFRDRSITLMPILIEDVLLPASLKELKGFDLTQDRETGISSLAEELSHLQLIDLPQLSAGEFRDAAIDLLEEIGFKLVSRVALGKLGVGYEALLRAQDAFGSVSQQRWLAIVRHHKNRRIDLRAIRELIGIAEGDLSYSGCIMITSGRLTSVARDMVVSFASRSRFTIRVVDGLELRDLFLERPALARRHLSGASAVA